LVRNLDLELRSGNGGALMPIADIVDNPQFDCPAEAGNITALAERGVVVVADCSP
jgi:hypothetical protein